MQAETARLIDFNIRTHQKRSLLIPGANFSHAPVCLEVIAAELLSQHVICEMEREDLNLYQAPDFMHPFGISYTE